MFQVVTTSKRIARSRSRLFFLSAVALVALFFSYHQREALENSWRKSREDAVYNDEDLFVEKEAVFAASDNDLPRLDSNKNEVPAFVQEAGAAAAAAAAAVDGDDLPKKKTKVGFIHPLGGEELLFAPIVGFEGNYTYVLARSGGNFGNFVWWHAAMILIDKDAIEPEVIWSEKYPKDVDVGYMATANILGSTEFVERAGPNGLAKFLPVASGAIRSMKAPVIAVGMGANGIYLSATGKPIFMDLDPGEPVYQTDPTTENLAVEAQELLQAIEGTGVQNIFTRGAFTAGVAHKYGFNKAIGVGCPTFFINPSTTVGQDLEKKLSTFSKRVGDKSFKFAMTLPGQYAPKIMTLMYDILQRYPESTIVIQEQRDMNVIAKTRDLLTTFPPEFHDFVESRTVWFGTVQAWEEHYRTRDAIFGWRIHGAMVGVGVGTPVLLVSPDLRVAELAESMNIPLMNAHHPAFTPDFDPVEYMGKMKFDGKAFDVHRKHTAQVYVETFKSAGLPPSPHLLTLAQG